MKLGNNIAVAAILTTTNALAAHGIITRRLAALRANGEDVSNTASWRDALAEQAQFGRAVSMRTWHLRTTMGA